MERCELCPVEFLCGRLAAALTVAEALPPGMRRTRLRQVIAQTQARLASHGWRYPHSDTHCTLKDHPEVVRRLTEALVAALAEARGTAPKPLPTDSLLAEEHRQE